MATDSKDLFDKWLDAMAKPGNEGGTTGKRTNIKAPDGTTNTATGRWQMTDGTRDRAIISMMGGKDKVTQSQLNEARRRFNTDPTFERQVARHLLVTTDNSLSKDLPEKDRVRSWTKAWYTGKPDYPDDKVPYPGKGNKITAGYYADKVAYQLGYSKTSPVEPKSISKTTSTATQPSTKLSATNAPVNPEVVKELSRAANQGVIPPAEAQTFKPFTPTTTLPKLEADKKLNEPPTASKTGQLLTSTMAKSSDTKKYNAKALSPLKSMDMLPYLSNLYSATVRPPATPSPMLAPPTSLQRVSMDVDRNQLESDYRDTLRNSDLADVATSTRAKLAAKAQKFGQMSKINEVERNANIDISNKEREANLAIDMSNRQALYNKQLQDVERQNAILSQQSANFSNFTDKLIAQQGVKDQQDLELKKLDILANYDQFNNINNYMTKMGLKEKAAGGKLYTAGRFMKTLKPIKTIK